MLLVEVIFKYFVVCYKIYLPCFVVKILVITTNKSKETRLTKIKKLKWEGWNPQMKMKLALVLAACVLSLLVGSRATLGKLFNFWFSVCASV